MLLRRTTSAGALVTVLLTLAACGGPMTTDAGDARPGDATGDRVVPEAGPDVATPDMGTPDMGAPDMGAPDTGKPDMGTPDMGAPDMGTPDMGTPDATLDMGTPDTGATDTGTPDMGATDTGTTDAAPDATADAGTCPTPVHAITLPTDSYDGTLMGTSRNASTSCVTTTGGPEDYFTLNVTARTGVVLTTNDARTTVDTVLAVRSRCNDPTSEVACNDDVRGGVTASFIRTILDPGMYTVLVDQYGTGGTGGPYRLTTTAFTPAPNSTCGGATTLTPGTMLTGQDTTTGGAPNTNCLTGSNGATLYYSLSIPSGQRATITATPSPATARAVVRVLDSCAATACLNSGTSPTSGGAASADAINTGATPRTVIVAVSSLDITTPITFGLLATLTAVAPNADCITPTTLTPGTMLTAQTNAMGGLPSTLCSTADVGAQVYYSLTVPANNRATITATPGATERAVIRVLDACPATMCLTNGRSTAVGAAATVSFVNGGTTARTYVFSVSGSTTAPITFGLLATLTALAPNASCAGAVALTAGTSTMGNTAGGGDPATTCLTGSNGNQLYYSLSIPSGQRATITATGTSGQVALRVLDGCAATSCLYSATSSGAGMMASVTANNGSAAARTVYISISGTTTAPVTFSVLATLAPLAYTTTTFAGTCDALTAAAMAIPGVTTDDSVSDPPAALPFAIRFFGTSYGFFTATSNGFMQLFADATGSGDTAFTNAIIPTAGAPDNVIAPFWDDLVPDTTPGVVRMQTCGTTPNRHVTFEWTGWHPYTTSGTSLTFQAKLYETTNVIEFTYCTLTPSTDARVTGNSATIGLENATGTDGVLYSYNNAMAVSTATGIRFTPVP